MYTCNTKNFLRSAMSLVNYNNESKSMIVIIMKMMMMMDPPPISAQTLLTLPFACKCTKK